MRKIDLNVDIGEGFPNDLALLDFATSANVGCGVYAGDWELSQATIEICLAKGVRVGVHPGYPDRENFGRAPLPQNAKDAERWVGAIQGQVDRFQRVVAAAYFKPHGALYNESAANPQDLPGLCVQHVASSNKLPLMGLAGSAHAEIARAAWVPFIAEGFADRRYLPDGSLMPRSEPGSVLHDPGEIRDQVLYLATLVDSICLHGDTPDCVDFAAMVAQTLRDAGYEVGH